MPPAALGSICVSDCTDFNGALYCFIDGGGWGWCADQTGSCGNGQNETGKRQIQRKNVSVCHESLDWSCTKCKYNYRVVG